MSTVRSCGLLRGTIRDSDLERNRLSLIAQHVMDQLDQSKRKSDFHFNHGYREKMVLRDGHEVTLRLVRATDKELLRRSFERLSPESRYRRFFAAKKTVSEAELVYLTELDGPPARDLLKRLPARGHLRAEPL